LDSSSEKKKKGKNFFDSPGKRKGKKILPLPGSWRAGGKGNSSSFSPSEKEREKTGSKGKRNRGITGPPAPLWRDKKRKKEGRFAVRAQPGRKRARRRK